MDRDIEAKQVIEKLIDNLYRFDEVTMSVIEEKNKEAENFATEQAVGKIVGTRPYPEVIRNITPHHITYERFEDNGNNLQAEITFRKISYMNDTEENATDALSSLTVDLIYLHDGWKVDMYDEEQDVLYADYFANAIEDVNLPTSYEISQYLLDNYTKLTHIKYMYKGTTKEDLFEYKEDVYSDSFNMLYWLLERQELPVPIEIDRNDLLASELFIKVFDKGHKYKYNIDELVEGDILYFGKNDNNIGIYVGQGRYVTITGKFPKDNEKGIDIHDLETDWEQFNGKVIRLKEWY